MGCISTKKEIIIKAETLSNLAINSGQFVQKKAGNIFSDYNIVEFLGKGAFGRVYKVFHRLTGQYRAMKVIECKSADEKEILSIKKEIDILKNLDHPNIIKVFEFYQTKKYIYIINELCSGGELFDKIIESKYLNENLAAHIMQQIFSAVAYCHEKGVMHRDLKPENILIQDKKEKNNNDTFLIKIIDFGTSEIFSKANLTEQIGTSFYIAPEVLVGSYNEKCDLWSCGVIMFILLCGSPPFYGKTEKEIFQKIITCSYQFKQKIWDKISSEAKELIYFLFEPNPKNRPSAKEALKSSWIRKYCYDKTDKLDKITSQKNLSFIIQNISEFNAEQKLQQATLAFLVHNFAPQEEINEIRDLFFAFDKNGDGKLSKEEFKSGFLASSKKLGVYPNLSIDKIIKTIDNDNSDSIEFEEFLRASINKEKLLTEKNLKLAFNVFDQDKSGGVDSEELKIILGGLNKNANDILWKKMINEIDLNNDHEISYEEFKNMMMKVLNNKTSSTNCITNLNTFPKNNENEKFTKSNFISSNCGNSKVSGDKLSSINFECKDEKKNKTQNNDDENE